VSFGSRSFRSFATEMGAKMKRLRSPRFAVGVTAISVTAIFVAGAASTSVEARHRPRRRTTTIATTKPTTTKPATTQPATTQPATTQPMTTLKATTTAAATTIAVTTAAPTTAAPTTATPTTAAPTTVTATTQPPNPVGPRTPKPFPVSPKPFNFVTSNFADPFIAVTSASANVSGLIAPDWRDGSQFSDATVVYGSTPGHGGGVAQRMNVTAITRGQAQVSHEVGMVAGWRYEVTAWVKGTGSIQLALQEGPSPYAIYGDTAVLLNGNWQQVRLTALITGTNSGNLFIAASSKADFAFDDFDIRAIQASPAAVTGTKLTSDTYGIHEGRIASMQLRNPGFEGPGRIAGFGKAVPPYPALLSGNVAVGWGDNSFYANVTASYALDTTVVHGGNSSQRVDVASLPANELVQIGQYIYVPKATQLRFTQWVRGAAGARGQIQIRKTLPDYDPITSVDFTFTGSWQQVSVTGPDGSPYNGIFLNTTVFAPGSYWFDDANLTDLRTGASPDLKPAPSVGGTMRLWDTSTTWADLEPQKGVWDFTILDRFVNLAESRQQQVLLTLGQSPAWATSNPTERNYSGLGSVYAPTSIEDWRNMVKVLTTRYKGRIDAYEIWNEPNDGNFGKLSIAQLEQLTEVASQQIRANDPAAKVVSASPYSVGYLSDYLAAGMADFVDIIGYHVYNNTPENMLSELSNVRYTLADFGVTKPLWMTEGGSGDELQPEAATADALLRWSLVSTASGLERSFWYTWGPGFNISGASINLDTWVPNAAFNALADLQKRVAGRTLTKVTADTATGRWVMEFTNAQGNVLTASWTNGGTAPPLPVTWS
jgi:Glycosyl hydrolases family 39